MRMRTSIVWSMNRPQSKSFFCCGELWRAACGCAQLQVHSKPRATRALRRIAPAASHPDMHMHSTTHLQITCGIEELVNHVQSEA